MAGLFSTSITQDQQISHSLYCHGIYMVMVESDIKQNNHTILLNKSHPTA